MKDKKKNGGYSLIELVVTILMSGIIVAAIAGFLTTGLKHYRVVSAETAVQMEAQVVELFVTELFQESQDYHEVTSVSSGYDYAVGVKRDNKTYMLAKKGGELHFGEVSGADDAAQLASLASKGKSQTFLGQYVTAFGLDSDTASHSEARTNSNGLVYLELKFEVDGKTYDSSSKISLRNTNKN